MEYEDYEKVLILLKKAQKCIKQVHDCAEKKHDSYGEFYMNAGLYTVIEETEKLLVDIRNVFKKEENSCADFNDCLYSKVCNGRKCMHYNSPVKKEEVM